MKTIQNWYPKPPLVIFLSNNEAGKLKWTKLEESKRYKDQYGSGRSGSFKSKVVGDGWIRLYKELFRGMRDGLMQTTWKNNAKFVGYNGVGPPHFARWSRWHHHSLYTGDTHPARIDPSPYMWDGCSPPYYVHDWNPSTDYTVWSPQIESMNWIFMLEEARKVNPDFWFEISTWDGGIKQHNWYKKHGQTFTAQRYGGFVQFGMWLSRPKVVRDFRASTETRAQWEPYFMELVHAVDLIYSNPTLQRFWRHGELVQNVKGSHPYQVNVPHEYKDVPRWFLLDADINTKESWFRKWDKNQEMPVFPIALKLGSAPNQEWLVYAFSPLENKKSIKIYLPGYGKISVDTTPSGVFYYVSEKERKVRQL
ncbi:MAG: hypothetical protein D4R88_05265 [Methanosarcinales archaeon]|nr:MAG: hypothetical protein D4R88_05265 [Methanosarcinales archaeon]